MTSHYDRYGDYIVDRRQFLGSGTYGSVWRGYQILHGREGEEANLQSVAIKESAYDQKNIQQISTLQILTHPNIVRYIDYKISKDSIFLVMQLCEDGTLQDLLFQFSQEESLTDQVLYYYSQIVSGIRFMYEKNILHRDIKPSNILLKNNKIKIADFGTSKLKQENQMIRTLVGTTLFASPEILELFVGDENSYTQKSDIWSLGLILYLMFHYEKHHETAMKRLSGSLPWRGKSPIDVLNNIKTKPLVFHCQTMPEEIKEIISKMLTIDVDQRISFKQFFDIKLFETVKKPQKQPILKSAMNESVVDLQFSRSINCSQYELTLLNECTRQPQFLKRETVDFQLLKLLQIKDSQEYEEREINDAIKFYEILLQETEECNQKSKYSDLAFEIESQIYQLFFLKRFFIRKITSSSKGIRKSTHIELKNNIMEIFNINVQPETECEMILARRTMAISEKYFAYCQRFEGINIFLKGVFEELLNTSNIVEKEKLVMKVIKPNEHLNKESKLVLKTRKTFIFDNKDKLNAKMSKTEIYLIYDLINSTAFEYCCKLRRQQKKTSLSKAADFYEHYRSVRLTINIWQIIGRILQAYNQITF